MKFLRFESLQARIVVLFLILFLIVQGVGFSFIVKSISENSRAQLREELLIGERVFAQQLAQNGQRLVQAGNILAADFGFRSAVATNDSETVVSALRNSGNRIRADVTMFTGLDGMLVASSIPKVASGTKFPFPEMIKSAEREESAISIVQFAGVPYQLVVVPVKAPVPIGWIAFGFRIDDANAKDFEALTSITLSVVTREGAGPWQLVASSLPPALRGGVTEAVAAEKGANPLPLMSVVLGGEEYESRVATLTNQSGSTAVAILQRSVSAAAEPYQKLQATLLVLTLGGIGLLLVGSMVVSRRIVRPVRDLAASAKLIEAGDYSKPVAVYGSDEIGELASSFNHMQGAISAREARITELAYSDELTGLPNRALFMDRLDQAVKAARRKGQPMSVLVMDMDRFKFINDTLGHQHGDGVLRIVSERLAATLSRQSDTVARLGGDEFAVLLPVDDAAGATVVAQRVTKAMEEPLTVEGVNIDASMSIGIVTSPEHGEDAATLMRRADIAMYEAKRNGSSWAHYDLAFDSESGNRLSMLSELRSAMEKDELVLYYQPKVMLQTGGVAGAEVLIRWIHPVRGFVAPDQFIPYAEQTGFITQITRWVLSRAFAQCAACWRSGRALNIAINLSARDLQAPGLVEYIKGLLDEHAVKPNWITLEVTESAVMNDAARALTTLQELHQMGLKLSIDDFGTGYSSFAYLKKMPVDELKIDRSFVKDMISDRDDASIVRAVIELSHSLGLKVTAEGAENQEVVTALASMDCDLAQGYHWTKPLPMQQFEQWLDAHAMQTRPTLVVESGAFKKSPIAG